MRQTGYVSVLTRLPASSHHPHKIIFIKWDNMQYATIDYEFSGKVDWEDENTICIRGSKWYKPRCHVVRYGILSYYAIRFLEYLINKLK